MDAAFPYKEAITNAYGLIDHTTTHVASHSFLYPRGKSQRTIIHSWWENKCFRQFISTHTSIKWLRKLQNGNNVKQNKQIRRQDNLSGTASYQAKQMMQDYYSWSIYIYLSIHEQGRYLKYESYFTQICMIFFILCLASWMLSYSVVHAGLVLLVAKSHTPFTNWTDLPLK